MSISPFVEYAQFEQGNSGDSFYATGSVAEIGNEPGSFSSALSNKEQIRISFPVNAKTQMLANSSSIYYFNAQSGAWSIPAKALKDHVGPWKNVSVNAPSNLGSFFIEDVISFDHLGNSLASGSLDIFKETGSGTQYLTGRSQKIKEEGDIWQTNEQSFNSNGLSALCTQEFIKSFQRNPDYDSEAGVTFEIPTDKPFLLEKIVFEIPFCLGPGWFNDKSTECFTTSSLGNFTYEESIGNFLPSMNFFHPDPVGRKTGYFFDQGGPGITVALMSEKMYGTTKIRDLIAKSFFTHKDDIGKNIVFGLYPVQVGSSNRTNINSDIIGVDLERADSVVTGTISQNFTGSVLLKSEPSITNGCKFLMTSNRNMVGKTQQEIEDDIYEFLGKEYYQEDSPYGISVKIVGVDSFGRGMTGFSPSGGSIFGKEYSIQSIQGFKNPFYIKEEPKRLILAQDASQKFVTYGDTYIDFNCVAQTIGENPSPYLVYPGEKLILSVSKTRPATINFKANIRGDFAGFPLPRLTGMAQITSSSYYHNLGNASGHDVQFNTGSINMTFYGSYVRAGNSYVP